MQSALGGQDKFLEIPKTGLPHDRVHRRRLGSLSDGLVVVQVALSVILVVGAGLSVLSLVKASAVDVGFDPRNVVIASLSAGRQGYDEARATTLYSQLNERLKSSPAIKSVSLAEVAPFSGMHGTRLAIASKSVSNDASKVAVCSTRNSLGPRLTIARSMMRSPAAARRAAARGTARGRRG